MSAPEPVVQAVMRARGCEERGGKWRYCYWHGGTDGEWTDRGCKEAVRMADAAFAASLEWAADMVDAPILSDALRRMARGDAS